MKKLLLLLSVVAVGAANAALVPVLVNSAGASVGFDPMAGREAFEYTYVAALNPAATISGNHDEYLTIFDFAGYIPGSAALPSGWTISVQPIGKNPFPAGVVTDDPTLDNLTFQHTAGMSTPDTTFTFVVRSINGPDAIPGTFASQTTNAVLADTTIRNVGTVLVPNPLSGGDEGEIPEPMTMGLLGAGLAAMGLLRRHRSAN